MAYRSDITFDINRNLRRGAGCMSVCRESIKYLWIECAKALTNVRMYGSKRTMHRNVHPSKEGYVWLSKIFQYERPYKSGLQCQEWSRFYQAYRPIGQS